MSVRFKLIVLVLTVALLPISVLAFSTLRIHQRAMESNLASLHQAEAIHTAQRVTTQLEHLKADLQRLASNTLPWNDLSPEELVAALWMLYRTDDDIVAVALLDSSRRLLTQPAYLTEGAATEEPRHLPEPPTIVAAVSRHLPSANAQAIEPQFGEPFLIDGKQHPIASLAILLDAGDPAAPIRTLAVGVTLRGVCAAIHPSNTLELLLVDQSGRNLCKTAHWGPLVSVGDTPGMPIRPGSAVQSLHTRNGQEILRATAALPYGWQVIAEQPTRRAFAASHAMKRQALIWICASVLIALSAGTLLARSITVPVRRLVVGAEALARGELEHRFESPLDDELGHLGHAFNRMACEVAARDAEIRTWNLKLQHRVEERTRAIEQYHGRVVHAEKSAILAKLTAGVAAEVNDPLTAILGAIQLLASRVRADPSRAEEIRLFANAEQGAQRIRELIKRVQALGQRQPRSQLRPLAVRDVVESVVNLVSATLATECIDVVLSSEDDIPSIRGNFTQLEQAILQVLSNAIAACRAANRLAAETTLQSPSGDTKDATRRSRIGIQVERANQRYVALAIADSGIGIPTHALETIFEPFVTLRVDAGAGLGLAITKRIVEEHDGRLWAEANASGGATVRIWLPMAEQELG